MLSLDELDQVRQFLLMPVLLAMSLAGVVFCSLCSVFGLVGPLAMDLLTEEVSHRCKSNGFHSFVQKDYSAPIPFLQAYFLQQVVSE